MKLSAYAERVSCEPGDALRFHVTGDVPAGARVSVYDVPTDRLMLTSSLDGPLWRLGIPEDWPSSLYRAAFSGSGAAQADGPDADVHFVVRAARPGSDAAILVSVPFTTWHAYNRAGEPGESLYYAEEPTRAANPSTASRIGRDQYSSCPLTTSKR